MNKRREEKAASTKTTIYKLEKGDIYVPVRIKRVIIQWSRVTVELKILNSLNDGTNIGYDAINLLNQGYKQGGSTQKKRNGLRGVLVVFALGGLRLNEEKGDM